MAGEIVLATPVSDWIFCLWLEKLHWQLQEKESHQVQTLMKWRVALLQRSTSFVEGQNWENKQGK